MGGPAGIEAIGHTMNVALDTLTDEVEPFLLRSELVIRSPRGRMVTQKGLDHLGIKDISASEPDDDGGSVNHPEPDSDNQ